MKKNKIISIILSVVTAVSLVNATVCAKAVENTEQVENANYIQEESKEGTSKENPIIMGYNSVMSAVDLSNNFKSGTINKTSGDVWYKVTLYNGNKYLTVIPSGGDVIASVYDSSTDGLVLEKTYGKGKRVSNIINSDTSSANTYYIKLHTDSESDVSFKVMAGEPQYRAGKSGFTVNGQAQLSKSSRGNSTKCYFDLSNVSFIPDGAILTKVQCLGTTSGNGSDSIRFLSGKTNNGRYYEESCYQSNSYMSDDVFVRSTIYTPVKQRWAFYFKGSLGLYSSSYSVSPNITVWYSYPLFDEVL